MLPRPTGRKGRPFSGARLMVEGILYRYRCGIAWRDLPEVFGPWQTVDVASPHGHGGHLGQGARQAHRRR
ncbi:transposase [Saccharomonospora sp. CUA-673]|uniref:transposase n=1 Tax=Saccharomonospora sp. CUA-673 TaxID=1904969 RepID=UPI00351372E1